MTKKLFYTEPYTTALDTKVEKVIEKDGKFLVVLPETLFYPEGGGQPFDKGFIGGIEVLSVFEQDNLIYHLLPSAPSNTTVSCQIDFGRRFDHMQQHSGEHLLSGVFLKLFNAHNLGFHLGEEYISVDFSLADLSADMIREAEIKANEFIYEDIDIKSYLIDPMDVNNYPLRKLPKVSESIRVVEIDKLDYSPCCGTHVSRTGEIGIVKIMKTEKYKGMTRVYFKCGKRALSDFQNKHNIVTDLCTILSTNETSVLDMVKNSVQRNRDLTAEVRKVKEKLYSYEASALVNHSKSRTIAANYDDRSSGDIELIAKLVLQLGDYLVVMSSLPDKKIIVCHNGSVDISPGKFFKENIFRFNGKGGGNDRQAQASFGSSEDLLNFAAYVKESLMTSN